MTSASAMNLLAAMTWGSPHWLWPVAALAAVLLLIVLVCYRGLGWHSPARWLAVALKCGAIAAMAVCLLEPLIHGARPRPGANLFAVVVDNSHSLGIRDQQGAATRGELLAKQIHDDAPWLARLGQDFEVRRYLADSRLRSTDSFHALSFDGPASSLRGALETVARQFRGRPLAGVLLVTDGVATDWRDDAVDWKNLPPIFPVLVGEESRGRDLSVSRVTVAQTNFETSPVSVQCEVSGVGVAGEPVVLQLLDSAGKEVQRHVADFPKSGPLNHRFQFKPADPGLAFFQIRAMAQADEAKGASTSAASEATVENNSRLAMVDRGRGPYRVIYVGGRPNWEFKFLRRAVHDDPEVELVGLLRIAKREPKFSFRGRTGESTNPLFRGFGNQADDTAEQYDEPVLVRFGAKDAAELRDGFPKKAEQLFEYQAVILDDVEAEFFSQDQMTLLQKFVSQRGGAVLMLGGQETFAEGGYARTPLGDLLPVYVDKTRTAAPPGEYRWQLAREGWLQPWVRLRPTEPEEEQRLAAMPTFRTINAVSGLKPGASVLARLSSTATDPNGEALPALVTQPFGEGRSAALLVGDLWRWGLRREKPEQQDWAQSWRQVVRWLVSDVPGRVELRPQWDDSQPVPAVKLTVEVHDALFEPLDNATMELIVQTPDGKKIPVPVIPSDQVAGEYEASFVPRSPGGYVVAVTVKAPDGSDVGSAQAGFQHEPAAAEFRSLAPNRELLTQLAERTGGEVLRPDQLDSFVKELPNRRMPVTEPWVYPLWHQWPLLVFACVCLAGEWGLRRWKGLP